MRSFLRRFIAHSGFLGLKLVPPPSGCCLKEGLSDACWGGLPADNLAPDLTSSRMIHCKLVNSALVNPQTHLATCLFCAISTSCGLAVPYRGGYSACPVIPKPLLLWRGGCVCVVCFLISKRKLFLLQIWRQTLGRTETGGVVEMY